MPKTTNSATLDSTYDAVTDPVTEVTPLTDAALDALDTGPDPAGFLLGLWHGFIVPVTFLVSLFTDDVSIYEVQNSGNWYDFGFVIGVSAVFGGGAGGGARAGRR